MLVKDQVICLRVHDYSETSQVVTFLAHDHGKVGALAKGAKRSKSASGGPIEVFAYGPAVWADNPNAKLATLTEFQPRFDVVTGLSGHLEAYHAGLLAAELVNKLTQERDPHGGLYDGFLQYLQDVSSLQPGSVRGDEVLRRLIAFQVRLLKEIGLQPALETCANCQIPYSETWSERYFSSSANGLVCRDCEGAFADRVSLIHPVAEVMTGIHPLSTADHQVLRTIERLWVGHFTDLLHHRLKTAEYVLKAL